MTTTPQTARLTGAEILIRLLERQRVTSKAPASSRRAWRERPDAMESASRRRVPAQPT